RQPDHLLEFLVVLADGRGKRVEVNETVHIIEEGCAGRGHEHTCFTSANAASQTLGRSLRPLAYSPPPPPSAPSPASSRCCVYLGPNSFSWLSDGSSAHQATAMLTTIASTSERASPATNVTIVVPSSATEWAAHPANYLCYIPCMPLSRRGCGSRVQPFIRRVIFRFFRPPPASE
ncbi:hypothetical protein TSMEX_010102, partial [Taenia solium]